MPCLHVPARDTAPRSFTDTPKSFDSPCKMDSHLVAQGGGQDVIRRPAIYFGGFLRGIDLGLLVYIAPAVSRR